MTSMHALRVLFSPSGRLAPPTFIVAAIAIYLAGAASHMLTTPDVIFRAGLWPFLAVQALLIWIWFAVHAKRLHDADRAAGLAASVSILYALSVALLVVVAASFYGALAGQVPDANTASALGLILVLSIIAILLGAPHFDLAWLMVAILLTLAFVPIALAVATTLWAATRPSALQRTA
jgi:uncharacterized membrane protein YhaH (DUF805 family)